MGRTRKNQTRVCTVTGVETRCYKFLHQSEPCKSRRQLKAESSRRNKATVAKNV
jgi:hypothetical protein